MGTDVGEKSLYGETSEEIRQTSGYPCSAEEGDCGRIYFEPWAEIRKLQLEHPGSLVLSNDPAGEPSFSESLILFWGSGRAAANDFDTGRPVSGIINTGLMISDVFLVRSVAKGVLQGGWRAALSLPKPGSIEAAKLKGATGEALTLWERRLRLERIIGDQITLNAGGGRARTDFITRKWFSSNLKVVESKMGSQARFSPGQATVYRSIQQTGSATARGRKAVRVLGKEGLEGSVKRGVPLNNLEVIEQRFPLIEKVLDWLF